MASRILHPSRPSKSNDPTSAEKPAKLSKRMSLSDTPTSSSKIPLQTSTRSRSSIKTAKKSDAGPSVGQSNGAKSQSTPVRQGQKNLAANRGTDQLASGIPRGLNSGMGNQTTVSARPVPLRNRLRRKASSSDQRSEYAGSEPSRGSREALSRPQNALETSTDANPDPHPGSVFGIALPTLSTTTQHHSPPQMPPEFAHLQTRNEPKVAPTTPHANPIPDLKPPTPSFARSNSASTRYSESPSPWSSASTPTSVSSSSPAISQIPKFATRARQSSPTRSRPPITRRKIGGLGYENEEIVEDQGLSAVRESITSSSSSSTMRASESVIDSAQVAKEKIPPTPPLRISSKSKQNKPNLTGHSLRQDTKPPAQLLSKPPEASSSQQGQLHSRLPALNTSRSKIPPPRPSREGTPTLENLKLPIIQSNMSHISTTGHTRRESAEKALPSAPKGDEENEPPKRSISRPPSVTSNSSKSALPIPSATSQAKITSPHLYPRESSRSREPVPTRMEKERQTKRDPSPLFTSPSKSGSKFGFFSRKSKLPAGQTSTSTVEKPARKGPAAGTGHEGYGRYARRGRSSSTGTAASRGRSTSTDRTSFSVTGPVSSRKSSFTNSEGKPELDEFLKDRLEPVIIGGGGKIIDNRNGGLGLYGMQSNQTSSSSIDSFAAPVQAPLPQNSYPPSSNASSDNLSTGLTAYGLYQQAPDPVVESRPSLAHRRSLHRLQLFGEAPPMRIPSPINTRVLADSPALDTYDSTLSSMPQTDTSLPLTDDLSEGHEGNWLNPKKKAQGKSKLRRWNIFHRPQRSSERPLDGPLDSNDSWNRLPLGVTAFGDSRPIAHYAMVDGFESDGSENLEDALRHIEENLDFADDGEFILPEIPVQAREPSMLLPSPPKFPSRFEPFPRPSSPVKVVLQPAETPSDIDAQTSPERLPRLQQIGRIPRVISKRDRNFHPSPQSFSRPFAPRSNSDQTIEALASAPVSALERPTLGLETDLQPLALFATPIEKPASAPPTNGMLHNLDDEHEFLRFSRRLDSESSSSGVLNLEPITAMVPPPDAVLSDDEVWDEYDDFIDHVASPSTISPDTPGLPKFTGFPFGASDLSDRPAPDPETVSGPANTNELREAAEAAALATYKPVLPPRPNFLGPPTDQDQLYSPISLSDLYAGYGSRSSATKSTIRHSNASTISGSRYSSQTIISESASPSASDSAHMKRVTQVLAEKTYEASSDSLRFSALMTSRWLSFDRVLFSPVQSEIRNSRQDRILVVDGLQNDDWSTYCALTYPETNVYNLCSTSALWTRKAAEVSNADKWMPPTNHRRISYSNISAPFPFPKGFFTAVVFRFPAASTDYAYRNAIAECKRVLRPGGYLELTILDMDMVNMGNHVSRAIRNLKVRMQAAVPDISLSPASDDVMKLLGRKGFENISRCIVGVPVTGALSSPRTGSMNGPGSVPSPDREAAEIGAQLSLGALLAGQAQGADLHYPVTKMVARVARWWWSKCYESSILGESRESVWSNKDLLRECEERETGLRLVICYAQKPISARRRTVSV